MRKFVKATCTTLAMIGLCAGSAFAATQQFNGDTIIEVGGIAIGSDGSAACNLNEILFTSDGAVKFNTANGAASYGAGGIYYPSNASLTFADGAVIDFDGSYSFINLNAGGSLNMGIPDVNGEQNAIYTNSSSRFTISALERLRVKMEYGEPEFNMTDNYARLTCTNFQEPPLYSYAAGLYLNQKNQEDVFGYRACMAATEGTVGFGISEMSIDFTSPKPVDGDLKHGIEISDDGFIWSWVGPYEYDNGTPNWDDPSSIDPTKLHCRFTIENVSAGTSGFEGAIPDGYAAGSAGRSVMMFSWKEPLFSYDSVEEDVVMDFQDPSAELWLYEEKEGEDDDVDARLIAYEGAARVMTKTASTGAVKAELRAESDGDVVIRLGSN